jgi:carbon starvation protein CstA
VLGRLTFHARQVQLGRRKPFSWVLLWDIPIALCMGWVAYGLATAMKISWEATISLALVASYLGPYSMDVLFVKWSDWKFGKRPKDDAN